MLGDELVGAWFVGSTALGGFVPGESDVDIAAVCDAQLAEATKQAVVDALEGAFAECPTRGLELSLYPRAVATSALASDDAGFEVNVNGGPRMETVLRVTPPEQPGFWYLLDRAIVHRHGVTIAGPPADSVFVDAGRPPLLAAM